MHRKTETGPAVRLIGDSAGAMTEMALFGQKIALGALRAEMIGLAKMMPGREVGAGDEARRRAEEAEIEAGFDNMPV